MEYHHCQFCTYKSKYKSDTKRHMKNVHKTDQESSNEEMRNNQGVNVAKSIQVPAQQVIHISAPTTNDKKPIFIPAKGGIIGDKMELFDVRLIKNFKLFISGPSGCGKTVFISNLLKNLDNFAVEPPKVLIYVYRIWQEKYEEMGVDYFIEDGPDLEKKIKNIAKNQPTLVVFDDLINSESTPSIAKFFTVDGRHMNMSMIFVTQKMFVNDNSFREISGNSSYFVIFKNPRHQSEIRTLASQMGKKDLVKYYERATEKPHSYLFINLTQQCHDQVRFTSHLFNKAHVVRVYHDQNLMSLHDAHKGTKTDFSKMFLTDEIEEECNCVDTNWMDTDDGNGFNGDDYDVDDGHGLDEDDDDDDDDDAQLLRDLMNIRGDTPQHSIPETMDTKTTAMKDKQTKNASTETETTSVKNISTQTDAKKSDTKKSKSNDKKLSKIEPLKVKRLLKVKKISPSGVVLKKSYTIRPKTSNQQQESNVGRALVPTPRNQLVDRIDKASVRASPYNVKKQKPTVDVNKFGGSQSVDTWMKENEDPKIVDLGESMQVDDPRPNERVETNETLENYPIVLHMNQDEDNFELYDELQCHICDEVLPSKAILNKHKSTCTVSSYGCTMCGINFPSNNGLKSHMKSMHETKSTNLDKVKARAEKNRK